MKSFALEIRTPEKALFMGRVTSLTVPASAGGLGVLADHAPLAAQLAAGKVSYRSEEDVPAEQKCGGGFLIVANNLATLLITN
jgi:F0F1-type ATP synthase epsilon subunit